MGGRRNRRAQQAPVNKSTAIMIMNFEREPDKTATGNGAVRLVVYDDDEVAISDHTLRSRLLSYRS